MQFSVFFAKTLEALNCISIKEVSAAYVYELYKSLLPTFT